MNSGGVFVEKLLMFNKPFVSCSYDVVYQQKRDASGSGSSVSTHISYYMATVEMESIFIKQEHTCALKSIAGLAFTTVFSDVCYKGIYALVHMRSNRGK